jgi:hypothetical protein
VDFMDKMDSMEQFSSRLAPCAKPIDRLGVEGLYYYERVADSDLDHRLKY